jgi:predicted  nucleic acid-binding Zn ribbon protein
MLFEGRFLLTVKSTTQNLFKNPNESLQDKMKLVADDINNVQISNFIKNSWFSFHLYETYKNYDLKYHQPLEVSPFSMLVRDKDFNIAFKVKSEVIKVLKITGTELTFSNSKNEDYTVILSNDIEIINI